MTDEINSSNPIVAAVQLLYAYFRHTPTNEQFRLEVGKVIKENGANGVAEAVVNQLVNTCERFPTMAQVKNAIAEQRSRLAPKNFTGSVCPDCNGARWVYYRSILVDGTEVARWTHGSYDQVKGCERCGSTSLFTAGSGRVEKDSVTAEEREAMRTLTAEEAAVWINRIRKWGEHIAQVRYDF